MSILNKIGQGFDTAVLGGAFRRASQDREMHRLDVDRIRQNMDFQRQQQIRQKSIDSVNQAKEMAALDDITRPVAGDRVQQILNPAQQQQAANAGVIGLEQFERPVDQARRSDIQMLDGSTQVRERMTPDELVSRGLDRQRQSVVNTGVAQAEADDEIRKRLGIPLPSKVAQTLAIDPDFRVKPGEMRGYVDAAIDSDRIVNDRDRWTAGRTAKQVYKTELIQSPDGQVERTLYRDGTYEDRPVPGQMIRPGVQKSPAAQKKGAGGTKDLTPYQRETLNRRDADKLDRQAGAIQKEIDTLTKKAYEVGQKVKSPKEREKTLAALKEQIISKNNEKKALLANKKQPGSAGGDKAASMRQKYGY